MGFKLGNRSKHIARFICAIMVFTGVFALVPDLVDKPLWLLGLGDGRTHHEALGYLGVVNAVGGVILTVSLVCRYTLSRLLRRR